MAQKAKRLEEVLFLSGEVAEVVSYADYFAHRPLFSSLRIKNTGEETIEGLLLNVEATNGMIVACEKQLDIPYESVVDHINRIT